MTSGERRLGERLEQRLEDDYLPWCDVPIGTSGRHPDFMVLHPRHDLLILEIKGGKLAAIQAVDNATATLLLPTCPRRVLHPLEQARGYEPIMLSLLKPRDLRAFTYELLLKQRYQAEFRAGQRAISTCCSRLSLCAIDYIPRDFQVTQIRHQRNSNSATYTGSLRTSGSPEPAA